MKKTKEMQEFIKNYELYDSFYGVCQMYNEFTQEFDLSIGFDCVESETSRDIICTVYSEKIKKYIVISWDCKEYSDTEFYNDIITYLLELEQEAQDILEIL